MLSFLRSILKQFGQRDFQTRGKALEQRQCRIRLSPLNAGQVVGADVDDFCQLFLRMSFDFRRLLIRFPNSFRSSITASQFKGSMDTHVVYE